MVNKVVSMITNDEIKNIIQSDHPTLEGATVIPSNNTNIDDLKEILTDDVLSQMYTDLTEAGGTMYNINENMDYGVSSISDGGNDMYDGGNKISFDSNSDHFSYTDTVTTYSGSVKYFMKIGSSATNRFFIFVSDVDSSISSVQINGNNGADGSGTIQTGDFTITKDSTEYRVLWKSIHDGRSNGDPTINHIWIVKNVGTITTTRGTTTDDDKDILNINSSIDRVYYILWGGARDDAHTNQTEVKAVVDSFLSNIVSSSIKPYSNLVLTFSKEVIKDSGNIYIKKTEDDQVIETINITDDNKVFGNKLFLNFDDNINDYYGNDDYNTIETSNTSYDTETPDGFDGKSIKLKTDAVNGYVQIPITDDLKLYDNDFTFEFWFRTFSEELVDDNMCVLGCWPGSTGSQHACYFLKFDKAKRKIIFRFRLSKSKANADVATLAIAGTAEFSSDNNSYSHDQWHHFALVRHDDIFAMYIDGIGQVVGNLKVGEDPSGTDTDDNGNIIGRRFIVNPTSDNRLMIGSQEGPGLFSQYNLNFKGYIDDFSFTRGAKYPVRSLGSQNYETINFTSSKEINAPNQMYINPDDELSDHSEYYVLIDSTAFKDRAGNYYDGIHSKTDFSFSYIKTSLSNKSINENSDSGTTIGTFSTIGLNTSDTFTYSIVSVDGDTDNSDFTISGSNLLSNKVFDYEDKASYSIRIQITDNNNNTISKPFTISITNQNDTPTFSPTTASADATEDSEFTYTVDTASDVDSGDSITYSMESNPNWISFNTSTRVLSGTPTNTDLGSNTVVIRATDSSNAYAEFTLTISVANKNNTPTFSSTTASVDATEDSEFTYTVDTASDVDSGDSLTYSMESNPNWVSFNTTTRVLSGTPTNTDVGSNTVVIRATDSSSAYAEFTLTITVENTNDTPTDISLSDNSINENSDIGTTIGTFSTTDQDTNESFTYSLVSGNGDTDNSDFTISGSDLLSNKVFDYEDKDSYSIRVQTTDNNGATFQKQFTINITNQNDTPTDISLSNNSINENSIIGTQIGKFSTNDQDTDDSFTYKLVSGDGDTNNSDFIIIGKKLFSNKVFNYEEKNSYSIRVKASDNNSGTFKKKFTIVVINEEFEKPTDCKLNYDSIHINNVVCESIPKGSIIGLLSTDDDNTDEEHIYSLVNNDIFSDNNYFKIEGNKLITDKTLKHRDGDIPYTIKIKTEDPQNLSFKKVFSIRVNKINSTPSFIFIEDIPINSNYKNLFISNISKIIFYHYYHKQISKIFHFKPNQLILLNLLAPIISSNKISSYQRKILLVFYYIIFQMGFIINFSLSSGFTLVKKIN